MSSDPSGGAARPGEVRLDHVVKRYRRGGRRGLLSFWKGPRDDSDLVVALDGIDLEVAPGSSVGLIGPNGSGKSTLLKVLAGVTEPSSGRATCTGAIGSMIELELGFHAELTGIENIRASAALAGVSPGELRRLLPDIVEFAAIGAAVDSPLKHYSTGMRARLGFALATHVPADVLLVDEVLAVGDLEFQRRCIDRIADLVAAGTTLIFVSHEMHLIDSVCERTVRLDSGSVVDDGASAEVIERYLTPTIEGLEEATDPRVRLGAVEVRRSEVPSWGRIELEVELELDEPLADAEVALQLAWQAIAPDRPFGFSSQPLPVAARGIGRHRLVATTSPIPLDGGHARLEVAVLDGPERRVLDRAVGEAWIENRAVRDQPGLAATVDWQLDAVAARVEDQVDVVATERPAAGLDGVTKQFTGRWHGSRFAARWDGGGVVERAVRALDDVTLAFDRGAVTGVIGPNGAGKTTLLRVLAGVSEPTRGSAWVDGRVVSMLELGLGFHPDLTGLENVKASARILGMTRAEVEAALPAILDFAGIDVAVHHPFRKYSTGMQARLGLALAMHADADVLLIDETLSVGDQEFRGRAIERLRELCRAGVAAVFVSHELDVVAEVADRVVRLDQGRVVDDGPTDRVLASAGGRTADRGVRQVSNEVRLHPLTLPVQHVPSGEDLVFEGEVEVVEPSPTVRLEISYRAKSAASKDRRHVRTQQTLLAKLVEPPGGLATPGRHRYQARISGNALVGTIYVFVTAVEEINGEVVAEAWHDVAFGTRGAGRRPEIQFDATWTASDALTSASMDR
jgi:ABC-type polysaccharide/polyol phosphate transport system ATPase subunit